MATVLSITDGDTLKAQVNSQVITIRLAEIDAPERDQPFGKNAHAALEQLVAGKKLWITVIDIDRYDRQVAQLMTQGSNQDVNAALVSAGYAWVYRQYPHRPLLLSLETAAREKRVGLWSGKDSVAPWDWRKGIRQAPPKSTPLEGYYCRGKQFCRQMISCAEALFYLKNCEVKRLDGDEDGVPCEKLCR